MEGRRYSDGLHQAIEAKENVKIEDATQTFATITLQNYFRMYKMKPNIIYRLDRFGRGGHHRPFNDLEYS
jgi:hypothetical protein